MAVVHRAEITPGKLDLLAAWLPGQEWFSDDGPLERVATFRFDDPAGQVGLETFLVRSGMFTFHVPLTYRDAPLDGGTLIGELEHSALGHRWVYDGPSDPVYVAATTDAIASGAHDVEMFYADGEHVPRPPWIAHAVGSGRPDRAAGDRLVVARALPADVPAGAATLDVDGGGLDTTVTVAWLV